MNRKSGIIPRINIPKDEHIIFNKWIKNARGSMYSILILDISGYMKNDYKSLFDMANEIIINQMTNEGNEGVIVLFKKETNVVINEEYGLLNLEKDINYVELPNGANFYNVFKDTKNSFIIKSILIKKGFYS